MTDEFLLEAMREVDALTPACPPIAPPRMSPQEIARSQLLRAIPPNPQDAWMLANSYVTCEDCGDEHAREAVALFGGCPSRHRGGR